LSFDLGHAVLEPNPIGIRSPDSDARYRLLDSNGPAVTVGILPSLFVVLTERSVSVHCQPPILREHYTDLWFLSTGLPLCHPPGAQNFEAAS